MLARVPAGAGELGARLSPRSPPKLCASVFFPISTRFIDFGGPVKARSLALLAALVTAALVVAGCGGADDTAGGGSSSAGSSSAGGSKARLSLVAYSTPQVVYDQVIPQF